MKKIFCVVLYVGIMLLIGCKEKNVMNIEEVYRQALSCYLMDKLELQEYDEQLARSTMKYIANTDEDVTESQGKDKMGLTYIYLRNDLYVERLTSDEKDTFLEAVQKKGFDSAEAKEVVEDTFAKIITPEEIVTEEDKKVETIYDMTMNPDFVTMDSLVLVIGTMSEFDEKGNYVDLSHEEKKREQLVIFCREMEKDLEGKLEDVPVRVLLEP